MSKSINEICQLCNNHKLELFHNKGRNNNNKVLNYICKKCGFIAIYPRINTSTKDILYKEGEFSISARQSSVLTTEKIKKSEFTSYRYFNILSNVLNDELYQKNKKCLEVGCGSGSFLRYMKASGWEVEGIEPDKKFSDKGKVIYDLNIHNDFFEDFVTEKKYDLIASFHVIEHVDKINDYLQKMYNLLNEGGIIYLECPSIDYIYGDDIDFFFWDVHINTFSNYTLQSFLIKNGFEVLELKKNNSFVNIIGKKSSKSIKNNYSSFFDTPSRIKSLITARENKLIDNKKPKNLKKKTKKLIKKVLRYRKKLFVKKNIKIYNYTISHLGFHHSKNTGDIALFVSLREQFINFLGSIDFKLLNLHNIVDQKLIDTINKTDALIIGGGGLFLKDTNKNDISGWQWPCSIENLKKIKVPIIIYAVGYNRFRNQEDFEPFFKDNINELFKQSSFIGLRNHGSINSVKEYMETNELANKILYQPCSTTLLNDYYPYYYKRETNKIKKIAFNIAFDRHYMRYGSADIENKILNSVCAVIKKLINDGFEVVLLGHVTNDIEFDIWLKANDIYLDYISLIGVDLHKCIEVYRTFDLVAGTRGHSQMIPFGLNIPIISLISHDKLRYFLEDNDLNEKGIELNSSNLEFELYHLITKELKHKTDFSSKQDEIRNITNINLSNIKKSIDAFKQRRN